MVENEALGNSRAQAAVVVARTRSDLLEFHTQVVIRVQLHVGRAVLFRKVYPASALHLIGLLSDGNVHSHMDHFYAVIDHAVKRGVLRLYVHALLDGRDVPYQSALSYLEPMEAKLASSRREYPGRDYAIASGGGREGLKAAGPRGAGSAGRVDEAEGRGGAWTNSDAAQGPGGGHRGDSRSKLDRI